MLNRIVDSRWFALADLVLVSASIVLWEINPSLGWLPLLLALFPWGLRMLAGRFPFQRTPFDFFLLIFLITAAVGVWTAYNTEGAWAKFWLLIGAVLIFYAFAGQPEDNFWILVVVLSLIGLGVALFFFFTHDWDVQPAKVDFLNHIGLNWMAFRPTPSMKGIHPNDAGGLLAMMSPLILLMASRLWRKGNRTLQGALILLCGLLLGIFLMTTSRGAWVAFAIMIGFGLLWRLTDRWGGGDFRHKAVFGTAAAVLLGLGLWILVADTITIPGLKPIRQETYQGATRMELFRDGFDLAGDSPLIGNGLETFPGLYSRYILGIPFFFTLFAHNIFVDAAIEQGVLGVFAMGWVLFGSIWLLFKRLGTGSGSLFAMALLGCFVVMIVHNMVDNLIYYTLNAPLLFILPGFAVAVTLARASQEAPSQAGGARRWMYPVVGTAVLVGLLAGIWFRQQLMATWYAGLGAVQMAKIQLADFPSGRWDSGDDFDRIAVVEKLFLTALAYDPENRTANHRLGLIAMLDNDYQRAVPHLETALQVDPEHRGIRKALGYSYAWLGKFEQASGLLSDLPEVIQELDVYTWWWGTQGRDDLVQNARAMLERLTSVGAQPNGDGAAP
jgi:hypothetical protein